MAGAVENLVSENSDEHGKEKGNHNMENIEKSVEKCNNKEMKDSFPAYIPGADVKNQHGSNKDDCADMSQESKPFEKPLFSIKPLDNLPKEADISDFDLHLMHESHHSDPFGVLGWHQIQKRTDDQFIYVLRGWVKDAVKMAVSPTEDSEVILSGAETSIDLQERGHFLFQKAFIVSLIDLSETTVPVLKYVLSAKYKDGREVKIRDPFSFGLLLPTYDLELFKSGSCWHVDNLMGSHIMEIDGVLGVRFAVWSPNSRFVSLVCDRNQWDGRAYPMRKRHEFGVWEIFVPHISAGEKYGFRIHPKNGSADFVKIDPYAQEFENPPATASIVSSCDDAYKQEDKRFAWTDSDWVARRIKLGKEDAIRRQPMSIYEVHLPSWMRGENNSYLGYRELAKRIVKHVKNLNFTHVEFLPLAHHPFEGSWGYQVTGQFAPYSRLGTPDDFKYLVNTLHNHDIGVFLDFVPAHFCKDDWALAHYDGEPCYEYADPKEGEHKSWGTMVYNFGRNEVRSFLLGAAYHWLRRYHIDGLRIDAVSSMLYKNHCRPDGQWIPNEYGGDANLQALSLLQELNWVAHKEFPGIFTMAEESTSWQGVTDKEKGLGFDAKWDLGWMNDILCYMCMPFADRHKTHSKLTFRGLYMAHEKWVLPLSHDEVVNGKGSLIDKCGFKGTAFRDRIQNLKALYGYQVGHPGRPLLFMGGEIGQGREWKDDRSVDWHEGEENLRRKLCMFVSDLLGLYKTHEALYAGDDENWNFRWVDCDNSKDCLVAFLRSYEKWHNDILVATNLSQTDYVRYPLGVPHGGEWQVLINSDDWRYGGRMFGPGNLTKIHSTEGGRFGWPYCLWVDIPSFSCLYLKAPQPKVDATKSNNQLLD